MKCSFIFLINIVLINFCMATHNQAGEITYKQLSDFEIECTIKTFTRASSVPADRDSLQLCWGDGNCEWVLRSNGEVVGGIPQGEFVGNDMKRNVFKATHTYASFGTYTLSMVDPNRDGGILNINSGLSDNLPFFIDNTFELSASMNSSPVLLEEPIDIAFVGQLFIHAINAFDIDGDSIAYHIGVPKASLNTDVDNFVLPHEIGSFYNGAFSLDEQTGLVSWDSSVVQGKYNIAIDIITYRNGQENGRLVRDMRIDVTDGNVPGEIDPDSLFLDDVNLVNIGDTIVVQVEAFDPDVGQEVTLTAASGLFDFFAEPPTFVVNHNGNSASGTFTWIVRAEQGRQQPYMIVFKIRDEIGGAGFLIMQFKIAGNFTASVFDITDEKDIRIFPNPASAEMTIESNGDLKEYEIYDRIGNRIAQGTLFRRKEIALTALPPGVYFIVIDRGRALPFIKY